MGKYVLVSSARLDLKEINNYLAQKNPQAARKLQAKIREKCRQLADFPGMGRNREELALGLRSFPVDDYLIFYFHFQNRIEIVRVVSGYRDLDALFEDGHDS